MILTTWTYTCDGCGVQQVHKSSDSGYLKPLTAVFWYSNESPTKQERDFCDPCFKRLTDFMSNMKEQAK